VDKSGEGDKGLGTGEAIKLVEGERGGPGVGGFPG